MSSIRWRARSTACSIRSNYWCTPYATSRIRSPMIYALRSRNCARGWKKPPYLVTRARTINGMLDQIELLVHAVRNVSNSIAHDLRTPLAELRSRLEELALTKPSAEQTFTEIDAAVADVDRLIRIFNVLLRL